MTATIIDTGALEGLDWQHEPPCELTMCQSGHPPATHRYLMPTECHPCDKIICDPCVQMIRDWQERVDAHGGLHTCPTCRSLSDVPAQIWPLPRGKR